MNDMFKIFPMFKYEKRYSIARNHIFKFEKYRKTFVYYKCNYLLIFSEDIVRTICFVTVPLNLHIRL